MIKKLLFASTICVAPFFISHEAAAQSIPFQNAACPNTLGNQCSIPTWYAALNIQVNTEVYGSDGNIYQSQSTNNISNPTTDFTNWKPVAIYNSVTVTVNASGTGNLGTIASALTYFNNTSISALAIATIHPLAGTYSMGTSAIALNNPFGSRINIIGDQATPANVVLNFSGVTTTAANVRGLFELTNSSFGQIDGLTYNGPTNSVCTPTCGSGSSGYPGSIFVKAVGAGSNIKVGPNVTMAGGYSGVAAFFGANIVADGTSVSGGADGEYWAYGNGSVVSMVGACAQDAATPTIFAGAGALADNKGYVIMDGSHVGGNATGLSLFNDGGARANGPGGQALFGRDCSNNTHVNTIADIKFNDSDYLNVEGIGSYNSGTPRRHVFTNYSDGASYDDISGSSTSADVSNFNYTIHQWYNNTNTMGIGINKTGNAPFAADTTEASSFIGSSLKLKIGTNNKRGLTMDTSQNVSFVGYTQVGETTFTISGCSTSALTGTGTAGKFTSGTTGTCTAVITMNGATGLTAPHGWACSANDRTTPADVINQTADSTTTATLVGTTITNDVISFNCGAY